MSAECARRMKGSAAESAAAHARRMEAAAPSAQSSAAAAAMECTPVTAATAAPAVLSLRDVGQHRCNQEDGGGNGKGQSEHGEPRAYGARIPPASMKHRRARFPVVNNS
jgi:hypothetical protein